MEILLKQIYERILNVKEMPSGEHKRFEKDELLSFLEGVIFALLKKNN